MAYLFNITTTIMTVYVRFTLPNHAHCKCPHIHVYQSFTKYPNPATHQLNN